MKLQRQLRGLQVIDGLTVGPVQLEPNRLVAPYTVRQGGRESTTELIYRYEEEVFDPDGVADHNLATVMAAQVALNYGLFCKEIRLRGLLDRADRRFLTEAARNTAREIYVNKLLGPNPFLVGAARGLPAKRPDDFLLARLTFDDEPVQALPPWTTDRGRHAVLSSGGKDSLLSYGLLHELGLEPHPIFINESGRHWFTALNAHRHLAAEDPRTARVWTSSDRLFSWMLRRIPLVRADFATVRADIYPLRLWTVAVFIAGALPLLRRRGIGRLVIGDEYDTTQRSSHQGITHYAGLYDQSRYFDDAVSRYYMRKGWGVSQFSLIRPLSELLILKILTRRYPDLQRHQVSCHAAHLEQGRALPCGKCEKCRRMVAMLRALGGDPSACGYSMAQQEACLAAFARSGLHQEAACVQQTAQLLAEQGELQPGADVVARPRPEVLQLRFDRERSPLDVIPADLRARVYPLLMAHADGAVLRSGRSWASFDPLNEQSLAAPYRFEAPREDPGDGQGGSILLGELTSPEAKARLAQVDTALLPVGSLEQHGPHLPLDLDAHDADLLCREVAAACQPPRPLVLPLVPYGVSYHHDDFPGTVSISPTTLSRLVHEIGMGLARQGIAKLIIVNGHGGNEPALNFAAQTINRDAGIFTCVDTGESRDAEVEALCSTPNDVHAGEVETSTALATRPALVKQALARRSVPRFSSDYLDFSSKKGVNWYVRTHRISRTGVLGDPTRATVEKGREIWAVMVRNLVELVEDIRGRSLDDIHQRRY